jgi:hypothetical protein
MIGSFGAHDVIMAMASAGVTSQDRTMTIVPAARPALDLDRAARCLVLVNTGPRTGWALLPPTRREAWLVRLRHRGLDARLAAGEPAENSRLLAVRTRHLVSPASRRRIARRWEAVAAIAQVRPPRPHRDVVEELQKVADVLRADEPVGVRGVALATTTFGIAAHALRRPGAGGDDIAAAAARTALASM